VAPMSDAPVWSETIRVALTWRDDYLLLNGGICVGSVYDGEEDCFCANLLIDDEGGEVIVGFPNKQSAKIALVEAVKKELLNAG
jgi:hypothetical protein